MCSFLFDSENKTKKSEVLNNITAKVQVLLLFSKIWELPDRLFYHFLQKHSTSLAILKGFFKKPKLHYC